MHWDKADRAPLLLIAGSKDHIVPPKVAETVLEMYNRGGSGDGMEKGKAVVEYKEFDGRTHHIVGQEGWEEVADYALEWAENHIVIG